MTRDRNFTGKRVRVGRRTARILGSSGTIDVLPIKVAHVRKRFRGSSVIHVVSCRNAPMNMNGIGYSSVRTQSSVKGRKGGTMIRCSCLCVRWAGYVVGLGSAFTTMRTTNHRLTLLPSSQVGRVLGTITRTTLRRASCVLSRGQGSLRQVSPSGPGCSQLELARRQLQKVTSSVHGITALPSPLNEVLGRDVHPGNVELAGVDIPFKIVNVVCRTHPGIDFSIFSLYLGDNGTYVLGKKDSTSCSGHTVMRIVRRMLQRFGVSARVIRLLPTSHRTAQRLLRTTKCMSLVVPHNDDTLVSFMQRGTAVPMVRANTNVYRACFSRCKSATGKTAVVRGTGAHHIDIYGTLSYIVIRRDELSSLPLLYRGLGTSGIVVCTSPSTCRTLRKRCPTKLLGPTAPRDFKARFLSCGVTVGAIGDFRGTLKRVRRCDSQRDRDVIARGPRHTTLFAHVMSTTYMCAGMSATFASKTRFKLKTRVNVDARGLRTHKPVKLRRVASCG